MGRWLAPGLADAEKRILIAYVYLAKPVPATHKAAMSLLSRHIQVPLRAGRSRAI
jgi:hypothetical protein